MNSKLRYVMLLVTLVFGLSADDSQQEISSEKYGLKEYATKISFEKCIEQVELLCVILSDVLYELFAHTDYWKTQKLRPFSYFLSKDPTKWIYRKREWKRVDSCLSFLEKEQGHNAYYLGIFKQLLKQKKERSEKGLVDLIVLIESCLNHYPCQGVDSTLIPDAIDQRINNNWFKIKHYKSNVRLAVAHCSRSNHFQRNWLSYFLGTAATVGLGYYIAKHKNELQSWIEVTWVNIKRFWHEQIVSSPLASNFKNPLMLNVKPLVASLNSRDSQIDAYFKDLRPDLTETDRQAIIADVRAGNYDAIMQEWNKHINDMLQCDQEVAPLIFKFDSVFSEDSKMYGFFKWFKGDDKVTINFNSPENKQLREIYLSISKIPQGKKLGRLMDIRTQIKEVEFNKIMSQVDFLLSCLIVYMTFSIGKKIVTVCTGQHNKFEELRKSLSMLHRIYNKYENNCQALSVVDSGYSFFWIDQFKKHISRLSFAEQKMVLEDLCELESLHYKPSQKLAIIQRMYYNYHFLLPTQ